MREAEGGGAAALCSRRAERSGDSGSSSFPAGFAVGGPGPGPWEAVGGAGGAEPGAHTPEGERSSGQAWGREHGGVTMGWGTWGPRSGSPADSSVRNLGEMGFV